ncbi:MAG: single-stranded DNA-binding protein [Candidatus Fermentibacter sp.]|nr:single-stranded DNA-binding protein [Candidatus Fermentibacter sp.]
MNIRMPSINRVMISGNLVDEPRTDLLENGTHVANFRIASSQSFRGKDGEWHEKTCFVDVVAWRRTAELVAEYLRKGSPVLVEGELQTSSWQASDGTPRSRTEILARRVQFLEKPGQQQRSEPAAREEKASYTPADEPPDSESEYDDIPF